MQRGHNGFLMALGVLCWGGLAGAQSPSETPAALPVLAVPSAAPEAPAQPIVEVPVQAAAARWQPPRLDAVHLDGSSIQLDGLLSEETWLRAARVTELTRTEPVEGGPGFGPVEWRVFYDEDALYFGARVHQPAGVLRAHINPRDDLGNDDTVNIYINPSPGADAGYVFRVNAMGVQRDMLSLNGVSSASWDGIWESAGQPLPDGYSVEVKIPFRTLRFSQVPEQTWGLGLAVFTASHAQIDFWPAISADRGSQFIQLGLLQGLRQIRPSHSLDIIPSLSLRYGGRANPGESFAWAAPKFVQLRQPGVVDPGLDLRYGVTSGLTANLTVNPDFSQVEADAAQLDYNLRFPLQLPEKRAFFLEGIANFETPIPLLYTRGVNDPVAGLKFTGKEGRMTVGFFSAWDQDAPPSRIRFDPKKVYQPSEFEDITGRDAITSVGRLAVDVAEGSRVGLFFAGKQLVDRDTTRLNARHELLSLDARLNLASIYFLTAQAGVSRTAKLGDSAPLAPFGMVNLRREDRRLQLIAEAAYYSPDFRAETSSLSRVGYLNTKATAGYKIEVNHPNLSYVQPSVTASLDRDATTFDRLDWSVTPSVTFQLPAQTTLTGSYAHGEEYYNGGRYAVRLGTLVATTSPASWLTTNLQLTGGARVNYNPEDSFLGQAVDAVLQLTLRPSNLSRIELSYIKSLFWSADGGTLIGDVNLLQLTAKYNLTPRWSVRGITQLHTYRRSLQSSLLLAYEYRPGTGLFLGVQDAEPTSSGALVPVDRRVFMKFSYLWSL
jgi:hypothetical protein